MGALLSRRDVLSFVRAQTHAELAKVRRYDVQHGLGAANAIARHCKVIKPTDWQALDRLLINTGRKRKDCLVELTMRFDIAEHFVQESCEQQWREWGTLQNTTVHVDGTNGLALVNHAHGVANELCL